MCGESLETSRSTLSGCEGGEKDVTDSRETSARKPLVVLSAISYWELIPHTCRAENCY